MVIRLPKKMSSIPISWEIKRKVEKIKFDLESRIGKNLTWDEFFDSIELKTINCKIRGDDGKK